MMTLFTSHSAHESSALSAVCRRSQSYDAAVPAMRWTVDHLILQFGVSLNVWVKSIKRISITKPIARSSDWPIGFVCNSIHSSYLLGEFCIFHLAACLQGVQESAPAYCSGYQKWAKSMNLRYNDSWVAATKLQPPVCHVRTKNS